jgi:hypothetical protein
MFSTESSPFDAVEESSVERPVTNIGGRPRVLLFRTNNHKAIFQRLLSSSCDLLERDSLPQSLGALEVSFDVAILQKSSPNDPTTLNVCRALRRWSPGLPILISGDFARRVHDRLELLSAGADICLPEPLDGRLVKLELRRLLLRSLRESTVSLWPEETWPTRTGENFTTEEEAFRERLDTEIVLHRNYALPCTVVCLRPQDPTLLPELARISRLILREYDTVYRSNDRVFAIVAEADDRGSDAFLSSLEQAWYFEWPSTAVLLYQGSADFKDEVLALLQ